MRGWFGCFLLTGVVYLLQLFPGTGIFLMFVAAPYWSVILINLGFALMIRDVWVGALPRVMLGAPLAWFGGYAVAAAVSHWQVGQYNAELAKANAVKRIPFDPNTADLVIEPDRDDQTNGSSLTPSSLIANFSVDRAYQVTDRKLDGTREWSLERVPCPGQMGAGVDGDRQWQKLTDGGYPKRSRMLFAQQLCLFQAEARPERPLIRVRPQPQVGRYDDATVSQDIAVSTPDGKVIILRSGWRRPLSWLPQPVLGCALDSGAPAWRCFSGFLRESLYSPEKDLIPQGPDDVVATALGLHKASIRDRYPAADWR
jgi:hypothetical protein